MCGDVRNHCIDQVRKRQVMSGLWLFIYHWLHQGTSPRAQHVLLHHVSSSINFSLKKLTVVRVSHSISSSFFFFLEAGSDLTDSDNCPPSPLLGWSFLMSFVCVCVYVVCSSRDEPRSRTQTDTQMLPIELHPQWVRVSRRALSFFTRRGVRPPEGGARDQ